MSTSEHYFAYVAGPFFNSEQDGWLSHIEASLAHLNLPFFSPRLSCKCPPDATKEMRQQVISSNCGAIDKSVFMFCLLDYLMPEDQKALPIPDTGTVWEMGYAYASYELTGIPFIVGVYQNGPPKNVNLMLSETMQGYLSDIKEFEEFVREASKCDPRTFQNIMHGNEDPVMPANLLERLHQWTGQIV